MAILEPTSDGSCEGHIRMAFLVNTRDFISGDHIR